MSRRHSLSTALRTNDESGQATTEFAIILFPLLLLVSGIIWFGIGLNFWLDMNRIANQGARWAVVDCGPPNVAQNVCDPSLQNYLEQQALSQGNNPTVTICYEEMSAGGGTQATAGDPITVRLTQPFTLVPMLDLTVDLNAAATMRMERVPTKGGLDSLDACDA